IAVARARACRLPKELSTSSCNGLLGQNARGFHERRTVGRFAEIAMILLLLHTHWRFVFPGLSCRASLSEIRHEFLPSDVSWQRLASTGMIHESHDAHTAICAG